MKFTKLLGKLPLLITALLVLAANVQAQSFLTDGLLAYYPFSGNALDATGNGHDGVVMGATLTTNRFGQVDSAYAFDGTNSLIVVSNSVDLQPLGDFSVSVWAVVRNNYTGQLIFGKHSEGATEGANISGWIMAVEPSAAGGLPLQFQAAPLFNSFSPQANIPFGTWFQAVFTYQRSSGTCNMYINGVLVDNRVRDYNDNNDPTPFVIGAQPYQLLLPVGGAPIVPRPPDRTTLGYTHYFTGLLDDIRIYDRALSSNEVQQLYTVEAGPPVQPRVETHNAIHLEFSHLTVGMQYQLQFSHRWHRWIDAGVPFTAKATCQSEYIDADYFDAHEVFWRLRIAP
jgi:hypothetical protein